MGPLSLQIVGQPLVEPIAAWDTQPVGVAQILTHGVAQKALSEQCQRIGRASKSTMLAG